MTSSALASVAAWLVNYTTQNPFKVIGTGTLTFGSLLLAPVFFGVEEMPQLDGPSLVPLLTVIAIGGLLVTLTLVAMPATAGLIARSNAGGSKWQSDWPTVFVHLVPGATATLLMWSAITDVNRSEPFWPWLVGIFVLCPGLAVLRVLRVRRARSRSDVATFWEPMWTLTANSLMVTALMAYLVITSTKIVLPEARSFDEITLSMGLWAVYACLITGASIRTKNAKTLLGVMAVAPLVAIGILVCTGGWTSISKAMLRKAGWADYPARLFVSDRGCEILNRSSGMEVCRKEQPNGPHTVCPVLVRSRVGTPNFFSFQPFTESGGWPRPANGVAASLPREDVIHQQRIKPLRGGSVKVAEELTTSPATFLATLHGDQAQWMQIECGSPPKPPEKVEPKKKPARASPPPQSSR